MRLLGGGCSVAGLFGRLRGGFGAPLGDRRGTREGVGNFLAFFCSWGRTFAGDFFFIKLESD